MGDHQYRARWLDHLVEHRHINPEVAGSNPALLDLSLLTLYNVFMYLVSFLCGLCDLFRLKG